MSDKVKSIRGIRYEVSEPRQNLRDGYFYQRVRQVDGDGNLVGIGEQIHRSANPNSADGLFARPLDLAKLGALVGDVGQMGAGGVTRNFRTISAGATKFAGDLAAGVTAGYKSWPGTHAPWEPILDWRTGSSGIDFVPDGPPGRTGDGNGIGNWPDHREAVPRTQPQPDMWANTPVPNFSPPPLPSGPTWKNVIVRDSAAAAGIPSRNNVFEYGFSESNSLQPPTGDARPLPLSTSPRSAIPIPFPPLASQRAPRGLPAMLAEIGGFDPSNPEAPPSGGLPGLIREYLRNH